MRDFFDKEREKDKKSFNIKLIKYYYLLTGPEPSDKDKLKTIGEFLSRLTSDLDEEKFIHNYGHAKNDFLDVADKIDEYLIKERGLSKEELQHRIPKDNKNRDCYRCLIPAMMNAKPDLAVVFTCNNEKYIRFIELKFESSEGTYKYEGGKWKQTEVQWHIARFLKENGYLGKDMKIAGIEKIHKTPIINFTRDSKKKDEIYIGSLIEAENGIW